MNLCVTGKKKQIERPAIDDYGLLELYAIYTV